ncbi:uncharacterized protein LOC135710255 [Ochlerotatus camptorhynchus]|uniref:uncharacterized protein LOC135710255 n=1 Tax=Ochlerotatus camptorhynchus TaxID=644619 RepID=UPI0031D0849F
MENRGRFLSRLSAYANKLPKTEKSRYVEKIKVINFIDPFETTLNERDFPTTVTVGHVVSYLLNHTVPGKMYVRNTRSIEAFKKFEAGFIHSVYGGVVNDLHIVRGKIYHSMRMNEPLLISWIIIQPNGSILSAHCTCVAGVSETCSHVSALLFALANLHFMTSTCKLTVTELPSYWARPAKRIKEDLNHAVVDIDYGFKITRNDDFNIQTNRNQFLDFVSSLESEVEEPVIVKKFCNSDRTCVDCRKNFMPDKIILNKNLVLANQFRPELELEKIEKIRQVIERVQLTVTHEEVAEVERLTRLQNRSDLWRWVRIGRITASVMRQCVHASPVTVPAKMSLLKKICHPYMVSSESEATRYGRINETRAKKSIEKEFQHHRNVCFEDCGIFIHQSKPYMAATPDYLVECDCCGKACIEIKCPFRLSNKQQSFNDLEYLVSDGDSFKIRTDHEYYLQVQSQIYASNARFGYFYVWSEVDQLCICVEKNTKLWEDSCKKAQVYFQNIILPELLGNYYSNRT